jgi:hypothetical protein
MQPVPHSACVFHKIAIMVLIGFAAVVLSGPLIAVAAALLPFAILGAMIYLLVKAMILGPYVVGKIIGEAFRGILFLLVIAPARALGKAGQAVSFVLRNAWSGLAVTLSVVFPSIVGGVIGALLGVIGGIEHSDADMRIPAGLFIGAAIGAVAGILLRERSHPKTVEVRV